MSLRRISGCASSRAQALATWPAVSNQASSARRNSVTRAGVNPKSTSSVSKRSRWPAATSQSMIAPKIWFAGLAKAARSVFFAPSSSPSRVCSFAYCRAWHSSGKWIPRLRLLKHGARAFQVAGFHVAARDFGRQFIGRALRGGPASPRRGWAQSQQIEGGPRGVLAAEQPEGAREQERVLLVDGIDLRDALFDARQPFGELRFLEGVRGDLQPGVAHVVPGQKALDDGDRRRLVARLERGIQERDSLAGPFPSAQRASNSRAKSFARFSRADWREANSR